MCSSSLRIQSCSHFKVSFPSSNNILNTWSDNYLIFSSTWVAHLDKAFIFSYPPMNDCLVCVTSFPALFHFFPHMVSPTVLHSVSSVQCSQRNPNMSLIWQIFFLWFYFQILPVPWLQILIALVHFWIFHLTTTCKPFTSLRSFQNFCSMSQIGFNMFYITLRTSQHNEFYILFDDSTWNGVTQIWIAFDFHQYTWWGKGMFFNWTCPTASDRMAGTTSVHSCLANSPVSYPEIISSTILFTM
jgi:hypothetical protein